MLHEWFYQTAAMLTGRAATAKVIGSDVLKTAQGGVSAR